MTILKTRSRIEGKYIVEDLFMGPDKDHLQAVGSLRLRVGEYQMFGTALLVGSDRMNGHFQVILEYPEGLSGEEFMSKVTEAGVE